MALAPVVTLRSQPSLQDISGWLRLLADEIERADPNDVQTLLILHVDTDGKLYPPRCLGNNPTRAEVVGMFQMAAVRHATGNWED